jgi:GH25 family lysozyme M1 (1,4-beta-N-acetylmuramidase)
MEKLSRHLILLFIFFSTAFSKINAQQCLGGGCTNFGTQYPSSGAPYTPPTSWQVLINPATGNAALMNAGNYTKFTVILGNTYEWSYCEVYGGMSTSWDAQLTLFNESNLTSPLCFSTDVCGTNGNAPYISWTATFTGTVRLLTTSYISGPGGCQTNSGSPYNKLVYRQFTAGSCVTPGTPINVTATATGQTTANLVWSAGSPTGSPNVTYFWVVGISPTVTYGNGVSQGNTSATSASTSNLSCNTTYYLRVYANTNCNNSSSGYGTSLSFTTSSCGNSAIYGVDISHYNGSVNWSTVYAAGKIFAFAKATEGVNTDDNTFTTNMTSSNPNGVILGAYHLGRPDFSSNNSPTNEANHFLNVAANYLGNGYLPAGLDMEPAYIDAYIAQGHTYNDLAQWINSWCSLVHNVSGKWPLLYVTKCYAVNLRSYYNGAINSNIKLWIATNNISTDPAGSPGTTACSGNWSGWPWVFHQFFAPTVAGNNPTTYADPGMDQDFFNGTISDLNILIGPGGSCSDNFETNDNCTTSTNVFASPLGTGTSNYTLNANIGYAGDQDWFKVNLATCGTLTITLSNLPFNYDMELYATGATCTSNIIQGSYNSGTSNEQIVFVNSSSTPATVYIKVYPFNPSTFTSASCYALNFQWASSSCCVIPAQPGAITGNTIVCPGSNQTYSITAVTGATSYTWAIPAGWTTAGSTLASITTTAGNTGGNISVTANNSCGSSIPRTLTVTVTPSVIPTISIQQGSCTGSQSNNTVSFNSTISNGGSTPTYLWTLVSGTGSPTSGTGSTFTLNNTSNGSQVKCILTSNANCANPITATSNILTINCIVTALPNISGLDSYSIIPNPNNGHFVVRMKLYNIKPVKFILRNLTGQVILETEAIQWIGERTKTFELSKMTSGIYMLETQVGLQIFTEKIVINH